MRRIFGGSWNDALQGARIAYRYWTTPDDRNYLGLRLARTPVQRMGQ